MAPSPASSPEATLELLLSRQQILDCVNLYPRIPDRFERRDGLWRIARRKCIAEWNANPGGELTDRLDGLFAAVGRSARDRGDVAYERPLAIAPERIGTRIAM